MKLFVNFGKMFAQHVHVLFNIRIVISYGFAYGNKSLDS